MVEVKQDQEQPQKIWKFRKNLTVGVMEDLGLNMTQLKEMKKTMDMKVIRSLMNALMIEGEPITRDTSLDDLTVALEQLPDFLGKGRLEQKRRELKSKRSPKR